MIIESYANYYYQALILRPDDTSFFVRINMKFLIATEPDDTHALLVKMALESLSHHVRSTDQAQELGID